MGRSLPALSEELVAHDFRSPGANVWFTAVREAGGSNLRVKATIASKQRESHTKSMEV